MRCSFAESLYYFGDVVFLKEPDSGDSGGSGSQTGLRVVQGDSPECEHWDSGAAGYSELLEACGRSTVLLEYRGEDCEVGRIFCCFVYLFWRVTRDRDHR